MAIFRGVLGTTSAFVLHLVKLGEFLVFAHVLLELSLFEQGHLSIDAGHEQVANVLRLDKALQHTLHLRLKVERASYIYTHAKLEGMVGKGDTYLELGLSEAFARLDHHQRLGQLSVLPPNLR